MFIVCGVLGCGIVYLWFSREILKTKLDGLQSRLKAAQERNASLDDKIIQCQTFFAQQQQKTDLLVHQLRQKIISLEMEKENPEMYAAFSAICRGENVFVHGKAGTGKSSFIKDVLRPRLPNTAYVTCTNIAALNIKGQTIYRFLSATPYSIFKPLHSWESIRREEITRKLSSIKTLVIDEVSMLHSRIFEALDQRLREIKRSSCPFGGMQIVLIGDLYQLPPIEKSNTKTSRFVFSSEVYPKLNIQFFELQKVYRQKDLAFSHALDVLRVGGDSLEKALEFINMHSAEKRSIYAPCLYPYRAAVEARNKKELAKLPGSSTRLTASFCPKWAWENESDLPAPKDLEIKPKAPVIFLANDPHGQFVNSDVGIILNIECGNRISILNARTKEIIYPSPYTWYQTTMNENGEQKENREVFFRQYPFQLAYAVTIHKAQGLTLEGASVNFGKRTFEVGQAYVALSRVKQLSGLYLEQPLKASDFKVSAEVESFLAKQKLLMSS